MFVPTSTYVSELSPVFEVVELTGTRTPMRKDDVKAARDNMKGIE
jgi:hypothetical protein